MARSPYKLETEDMDSMLSGSAPSPVSRMSGAAPPPGIGAGVPGAMNRNLAAPQFQRPSDLMPPTQNLQRPQGMPQLPGNLPSPVAGQPGAGRVQGKGQPFANREAMQPQQAPAAAPTPPITPAPYTAPEGVMPQPVQVAETKPKEGVMPVPQKPQTPAEVKPAEGVIPQPGKDEVIGDGKGQSSGQTVQSNILGGQSTGQWSSSLSALEEMARKWMAGEVDQTLFKNTLNKALTDMALINNAERDMLQMQINQDPNLKGQGAGVALLSMMGRDQGFSRDQMIGQLSEANLKMIMDFQKYGFEQGLRINGERRNRASADINSLIQSGNFEGAANLWNETLGKEYGNIGITMDPAKLAQRDPTSLSIFETQMSLIKDLARTDAKAAKELLKTLMADPRFSAFFPQGQNIDTIADGLINGLVSGVIDENMAKYDKLGQNLNADISSGYSFSQTMGDIKEYFKLRGWDAAKLGKELSLDEINKIREANGLSKFQESGGEIVDENGIPLDDQDYEELAYLNDYQGRKGRSKPNLVDSAYDYIMRNMPNASQLLEDPNAQDALRALLFQVSMGGGIKIDEQTGQVVLDSVDLANWDKNPSIYPYIYTWPAAVFGADGKVSGKYDMGGDAYGSIQQTPDEAERDKEIDKKFMAYLNGGGDLSPKEWYFATAGGTMPPNKANIPDEAKPPVVNLGGGQSTGEYKLPSQMTGSDLDAAMLTDDYVQKAITNGDLKTFNNASQIPTDTEAWKAMLAASGGYVALNGKPFKVDEYGKMSIKGIRSGGGLDKNATNFTSAALLKGKSGGSYIINYASGKVYKYFVHSQYGPVYGDEVELSSIA